MVNPSAMESRYRDRPESNSRQNFARFTGTRVTRVNSRVPEKKNAIDLSNPDLDFVLGIFVSFDLSFYFLFF